MTLNISAIFAALDDAETAIQTAESMILSADNADDAEEAMMPLSDASTAIDDLSSLLSALRPPMRKPQRRAPSAKPQRRKTKCPKRPRSS